MIPLRPAAFIGMLLAAIIGNLALENYEVRRDLADMKAIYGDFLQRRLGGKPLPELIHHGSMAVFKSGAYNVGCVLLK